MEQLDTPALIEALRQQTKTVHKGDLRAAEAMLMNQATALQSLFVKLAETGLQADLLRQQETGLRLALKAPKPMPGHPRNAGQHQEPARRLCQAGQRNHRPAAD